VSLSATENERLEQKHVLNVLGNCTRLLSKSTSEKRTAEKCVCKKSTGGRISLIMTEHGGLSKITEAAGCEIPTVLIGPVLY